MPDIEGYLPLTAREFHVLLALADATRNGYQISQQVGENSRGALRLSPATQFTVLHRLVERSLVREATDQEDERADGRGQRFWFLTDLGRAVLRAEGTRLQADARLALALARED